MQNKLAQVRASAVVVLVAASSPGLAQGRNVFEQTCAACHLGGVGGAPSIHDRQTWRVRLRQGEAVLVQHALDGHGAMPPRGGNAMLSDAQVRAAVRYMISRAMAAQRGTP